MSVFTCIEGAIDEPQIVENTAEWKQYQNLRVTISGEDNAIIAFEACRQGAKRWFEIIEPKSKRLLMSMTRDDAGRLLAALTAAIAADRPADAASSLKSLEIPIETTQPKRFPAQYRS